jgi:predicted enzyme related to lactoylglutathione lyase
MAKAFVCERDGSVMRVANDGTTHTGVPRKPARHTPAVKGEPMLSEYRVHAALPATDLERAMRFYAEKLGLTPSQERPEGVRYDCGDGSALFVFPASTSSRGGHTQAGIEVPNIEAAVAELRSRGVAFEEYDTGDVKTVDGIATEPGRSKGAWFKDSEGNLLGLVRFS